MVVAPVPCGAHRTWEPRRRCRDESTADGWPSLFVVRHPCPCCPAGFNNVGTESLPASKPLGTEELGLTKHKCFLGSAATSPLSPGGCCHCCVEQALASRRPSPIIDDADMHRLPMTGSSLQHRPARPVYNQPRQCRDEMASGELGVADRLVGCMSAAPQFLPPLLHVSVLSPSPPSPLATLPLVYTYGRPAAGGWMPSGLCALPADPEDPTTSARLRGSCGPPLPSTAVSHPFVVAAALLSPRRYPRSPTCCSSSLSAPSFCGTKAFESRA